MLNIHKNKGQIVFVSDDFKTILSFNLVDSSIYSDRAIITFVDDVVRNSVEKQFQNFCGTFNAILDDCLVVARVKSVEFGALDLIHVKFDNVALIKTQSKIDSVVERW